MANSYLVNIQGQINHESLQFTLASGTVTLKPRFTKWRPVGAPCMYGASTITAETVGVTGTPTTDGWFVGDVVVKSSGSNNTTGFLTIMGF